MNSALPNTRWSSLHETPRRRFRYDYSFKQRRKLPCLERKINVTFNRVSNPILVDYYLQKHCNISVVVLQQTCTSEFHSQWWRNFLRVTLSRGLFSVNIFIMHVFHVLLDLLFPVFTQFHLSIVSSFILVLSKLSKLLCRDFLF